MRVRDWQDIMEDVVESDVDPEGWRAVGGDRAGGIGEDLYVGHPAAGVFQLKTYAKNPFQVEGVGARVARRIDDELDPLFPSAGEEAGHFGVQEPVADEAEAEDRLSRLQTVVKTHAEAPTSPQALFEDIMDAMESPAYGPMEFESDDRPGSMSELSGTFEEAEELLDAEFEDVISEDVERGFY
ncbi:MAG: hypothetical protein ABEH56_00500 [Salinirussus sp.]